MDLSPDTQPFLAAVRRDGWTPALKARFLMALAEAGNVRLSARRCGLSAQSAYAQRRRDPVFARGWAAALVEAHGHAEQVLADRALDCVEEPIFYRGEQVGTRRRYDTRLLLAHLARLEAALLNDAAVRDAARFDELVALVAGAVPPEALGGGADDALPPDRETHAEAAAVAAEQAAKRALPRERGAAAQAERERAIAAAGDAAYEAAAGQWNAWFDHACATVDGLADPELPASAGGGAPDGGEPVDELAPQDPVNVSTSAAPPMERLTFAGFVFNRPADQQPRAIAEAGHPSETVGAGPDGPA